MDLRWGITEEQANEGLVLPLCLAEIERSLPYISSLLGEWYGCIPDTIRPEVMEREPWLEEHVHGRTSLTELEILQGVLNNPKVANDGLFFRNPAYVNKPALADPERRGLVQHSLQLDVDRYGHAEAAHRTAERKGILAALMQRIRDSKLTFVEPYADPQALAEIVRCQFAELIDCLYPEDQAPDPLAQERMAHEALKRASPYGRTARASETNQ